MKYQIRMTLALCLTATALTGCGTRAAKTENAEPPKLRFAQLTPEQLNEKQKAAVDATLSKSFKKAGLSGPFNILVRDPDLTLAVMPGFEYFRGNKAKLPQKHVELAIMTVARYWDSQFVWAAHKKPTLAEGIKEAALVALGRPIHLPPPRRAKTAARS